MIVILTDFGNTDIYTPVMQGVIKSVSPKSEILELNNNILPQNIEQAAFLLGISYRYFPEKSVFLCVVDPGVGSERKAVALETEKYYFVAPDNGLLTNILKNEKILNCVEISKSVYLSNDISSTFHGRDVFAPAAAIIDKEKNLKKIGNSLNFKSLLELDTKPNIQTDKITGKLLHIDSFGNAISSIHYKILQNKCIRDIQIKDIRLKDIRETFSDVQINETLAYFGSFGYLEFAVRNGNFAEQFKCNFFDKVQINFDYNS